MQVVRQGGRTAKPTGASPAFVPRAADGRLPAMEVRGLEFAYGKNRVLDGVNLLIEQGKVTTVMGSNGCGKSTLFSLMTKNLAPARGKVFLRGKNVQTMSLKDFACQVAIVHQNNTAADDMTVEQLVELGRAPHRRPLTDLGAEDERLVNWALDVTGTAAYRDRELARLSGGQRQRVWIAMALAQNTDILFLDEPTTYLDVRYQIEILELVRHLNSEFGMTIVMVLHDINQALAYSDVVVGLKDGQVAFAGDPNVMVTRESMRDLYGVDLEVLESHGVKHVLLQGADASAAMLEPVAAGGPAAGGPAAGDPAATGGHAAMEGLAAAVGNDAANDLAAKGGSIASDDLAELRTDAVASVHPSVASGEGVPVPAWAPDYAKPLARAKVQVDAPAALPDEDAATRTEPERSSGRMARALWTALGVVAFGLGTLGTVLPILPTVPLYLGALFCFAKGSQRLHDWFVSTSLYHKHLEGFVNHRGMTMRTKLSIIGTVTVVMGIAFALMGRVPVGRVILVVVWVAHIVYFMGFVKTEKPGESDDEAACEGDGVSDATGSPGRAPAWAPAETEEWEKA